MTIRDLLELQHKIMTAISDKVDDINDELRKSEILGDIEVYKMQSAKMSGALTIMSEVSQVFIETFDELQEVEDNV